MRASLALTVAALSIVTFACGPSGELQDTSEISYRAPGEVTRDLSPDDLAPPISKAELASFQPLPSPMASGAAHPFGLVTPARWDAYLAGDTAKLSPAEQRGLVVFVRAGCSSCHSGAYVGGQSFQKLGARVPWTMRTDSGRFNVTHKPSDLYVFKVASLRNVDKTAPYFHDGSVATLPQAVRLMGRHQLAVDLTEDQVREIRQYLGTLTGQIPVGYSAAPQLPSR